jgi:hypothetical protein
MYICAFRNLCATQIAIGVDSMELHRQPSMMGNIEARYDVWYSLLPKLASRAKELSQVDGRPQSWMPHGAELPLPEYL